MSEENNNNSQATAGKKVVKKLIKPQIPEGGEVPEGLYEYKDSFALFFTEDQDLLLNATEILKQDNIFVQALSKKADFHLVLELWSPKLIVFDDRTEGFKFVFKRLYDLEFPKRRGICVVFLSGRLKTGDSKQAFAHSVDSIIQHHDLNKIKSLLPEIMKKFKNQYSVLQAEHEGV